MSETGAASSRHRRSAVVLLGGLAAGAVLGAALSTNTDQPISEQFRDAFTPGVAEPAAYRPESIVISDPS
jgi:hypothetical protein